MSPQVTYVSRCQAWKHHTTQCHWSAKSSLYMDKIIKTSPVFLNGSFTGKMCWLPTWLKANISGSRSDVFGTAVFSPNSSAFGFSSYFASMKYERSVCVCVRTSTHTWICIIEPSGISSFFVLLHWFFRTVILKKRDKKTHLEVQARDKRRDQTKPNQTNLALGKLGLTGDNPKYILHSLVRPCTKGSNIGTQQNLEESHY